MGEFVTDLCFFCQKLAEQHAVVSVVLQDSSYSGSFKVPMCWGCASRLHVAPRESGVERIL